ncbi:hypothetical protein ABFS83_11G067400 [Erythranthe nasuta]
MVLGVKSSKHKKKGPSIKLDYIVHVQEIKPWPPSESLKSVQTVLLQWENTDENSGSFISVAGESNIVFNESFMLPLTLYRRKKVPEKFKKTYLEFTLSEPRKDNKTKPQPLGTASINLADYGLLVEDVLTVSAPLVFKKNIPNCSVQSFLAISLELVEKDSSNDSSRLSHEASLDNDDEDSEITSYTDDDASSHSSRTAGSSTFELAIASPSLSEKSGYGYAGIDLTRDRSKNSWGPPSADQASAGTWNKVKDYVSLSKFSERSMTLMKKKSEPPLIISAPILSTSFSDTSGRFNNIIPNSLLESISRDAIAGNQQHDNAQQTAEDRFLEKLAQEATPADHFKKSSVGNNSNFFEEKQSKQEKIMDETMKNSMEKRSTPKLSENVSKNQVPTRSDSLVPNRKIPAVPLSNKARLKHAKSDNIIGSVKSDLVDIPQKKSGKISAVIERKDSKKIDIYEGQKDWKIRAEMLEEELREAAVVEVGLYSVVPEHSSSVNKVHAPARRISRFYKNACGLNCRAKRASAARAAVSGLVLVSKTCGNDVTRLTFWLSNSIMLRSIVSQIAAELPGLKIEEQKSKSTEESDDCEDILTFIMALEKIESWLFSRIVESVWWQTFTPHMQPTVAKGGSRDKGSSAKKTSSGRKNSLGNLEQAKYSIELWKKAFRDACERLCPIRAGGHECGCLSVLIILVMGQLVNRLDVAMFNAILRESAQEMPTDPVSDPISDSKVLPVPAGKSSFTAGAQLKNVIGNWSRWLTDLFGLEDDNDDNFTNLENNTSNINRPKSFKAFRLLHALSDLMMLPFGMLADISTRKEVCPMFGPSIIKRVLKNFVPDEFSPHPIPRHIINAINSEEISDSSGDQIIMTFPCNATPTKYTAPCAALLTSVGEVGNKVIRSGRLSTLTKSYTSDDELDELDSPLTSIIPDSYQSSSALTRLGLMTKEKGSRNVIRYQLLREIWKDGE